MALVVNKDFHIPLFHETYPGNSPDAIQFSSIIDKLTKRILRIQGDKCKMILVFDKGNNSKDSQKDVDPNIFQVVSSLVPTQHADLLQVPRDKYKPLDKKRYPEVCVYRTMKEVYGRNRTVLVVYNSKLFLGQMQGINKSINKCAGKLDDLKTRLDNRAAGLIKGGRKPTVTSVQKQVKEILSVRYVNDLFDVNVFEEDGFTRLFFSFNEDSLKHLQEYLLGKTILFTDNHDWSNKDIVAAYRGQSKIEDAFKRMKDPHFLSWSPQFHWTDQKIMVHSFYCILALILCSLLRRELYCHGVELRYLIFWRIYPKSRKCLMFMVHLKRAKSDVNV